METKHLTDGELFSAIEAERGLASIAVTFPSEFASEIANSGLHVADIFDQLSRSICEIVLEQSAKNGSTDVRVVFERLRELMPVEFWQVSEIYTLCLILSPMQDFVGLIRNTAKRRALRELLFQANLKLQSRDHETSELIAEVSMKSEEIGRQLNPPKQADTKQLLMDAVIRYEKGADKTRLIKTGFPSLDNLTPIRSGDFVVIGGETKAGKTMLALNIIANIINENYKPNSV